MKPKPAVSELIAAARAAIAALQRELPLPNPPPLPANPPPKATRAKRKPGPPFPQAARDAIRKSRAEREGEALRGLCAIAASTLDSATVEASQAFAAQPEAAGEAVQPLVQSLTFAVRQLNAMAQTKPGLFKATAATMPMWPANATRHTTLGDALPGQTMLKSIGLGSALPGTFDGARWKVSDELSRIAEAYVRGIANARAAILAGKPEDAGPQFMAPAHWLSYAPPSPDLLAKIKALPPLDSDSWQAWSSVAEAHLRQRLSDPKDAARLGELVTAPKRRKSPGRAVAYIRQQLRKRIAGIAGARKF